MHAFAIPDELPFNSNSSLRIDQALTSQGVTPSSKVIERKPAGNVSDFRRGANAHLLRIRAGVDFIGRRLDGGAMCPQFQSAIPTCVRSHD
jgi:hypothetical protein